jgi:hypothetical protein
MIEVLTDQFVDGFIRTEFRRDIWTESCREGKDLTLPNLGALAVYRRDRFILHRRGHDDRQRRMVLFVTEPAIGFTSGLARFTTIVGIGVACIHR